MDIDKLYVLYNNNIVSVLNSAMVGTISDRSYDIHGYNLVNRLLIYIQNKYATSLRSDSGWDIIGRGIYGRSYPIWIMDNVIKTSYIDPDTNEVIEDMDLNPDEISKAVSLGAIKRHKDVVGLRCIPIFNIKDTVIVNADQYKEFLRNEHRKIKMSALLNIATNDFAVNCSKYSGQSTFDTKSGTVLIGDDGLDNKFRSILSGIFNQLKLEETVDNYVGEHGVESEVVLSIIGINKRIMEESIISYCVTEYGVESSTFKDMDDIDFSNPDNLECFIQITSLVYDVVEDIICRLSPKNHQISESTLRKAAELLNILESNEAISRLRG